jgi:hypothetical protein
MNIDKIIRNKSIFYGKHKFMISKPKSIISSLLKNTLFLLFISFNKVYGQQAPSLEITSYSDLLDADDNNLVGLNDVLSYSITLHV